MLAPVRDVTVKGIEVSGFTEGVQAYGTTRLTVTHVRARHSSDVGIFSGAGTRTSVIHSSATSNGSSGIRVDTSRHVRVDDNEARDNGTGIGIGINEDQYGSVAGNRVVDNCLGMLVFDTTEPAPTGDLGDVGLLLLDATNLTGGNQPTDNTVRSNTFTGNAPVQLSWDGTGTGNTFAKNRCAPTGDELCS